MHEHPVVNIHDRRDVSLGGLRQQIVITVGKSGLFPLPHKALENPQAGDVLQEADFSAGATLICEPGLSRRIRKHRLIGLYPEQGPGTRAEECADRLLPFLIRDGVYGARRIM